MEAYKWAILGHFHSFLLFFCMVTLKREPFFTKPFLHCDTNRNDAIDIFPVTLVPNGGLKIGYLEPFSQFVLFLAGFVAIITEVVIKK